MEAVYIEDNDYAGQSVLLLLRFRGKNKNDYTYRKKTTLSEIILKNVHMICICNIETIYFYESNV